MIENKTSEYSSWVNSKNTESFYLRERGLKPNIIGLIENPQEKTIIDVGCGDGWLFERVQPKIGYQCDIKKDKSLHNPMNFSIQDIHHLSYENEMFDTIVASMLLMLIDNLDIAITELYRTAKRGGELIISMTHPYFYRTGQKTDCGFLLNKKLSTEFVDDNFYISNKVGPLKYHYRRFDTYINTLINIGWKITKINDWFIDIEDYKKTLGEDYISLVKRSEDIPTFTFIKCVK